LNLLKNIENFKRF